jgi:hypothetical protein
VVLRDSGADLDEAALRRGAADFLRGAHFRAAGRAPAGLRRGMTVLTIVGSSRNVWDQRVGVKD